MKKYFLKKMFLVLFAFALSDLPAQQWCTPGSEWHFNDVRFGHGAGYKHWQYLRDTVIAGNTCHLIRDESFFTQALPGSPINYTHTIFTYTHNAVVYIKQINNPSGNVFDTLVNFNAAIGSKWRMAPTSMTTCSKSFVTVLDTGRRSIQGQSLKWMYLNYTFANGPGWPSLNKNDTLYERLGALSIYPYWPYNICPNTTDGEQGGKLRCFSDHQITNYKNNYEKACATDVGIAEGSQPGLIRFYPNPVSDRVTIYVEGIQDDLNMCLTDVSGRDILRRPIEKEPVAVDLQDLLPGIYFLQVKRKEVIVITRKLIKN